MRATGIIRRIDDLGRVVIPKEIRRTMGIREGDPLEIYTDKDGCVIFKKYVPCNFKEVAHDIVNALASMRIMAHVFDDMGECQDSTVVRSIDLEDEALIPFLFEIKDKENGDLWGYVRINGGAPNEFQKAQIEGVIAMALTNL